MNENCLSSYWDLFFLEQFWAQFETSREDYIRWRAFSQQKKKKSETLCELNHLLLSFKSHCCLRERIVILERSHLWSYFPTVKVQSFTVTVIGDGLYLKLFLWEYMHVYLVNGLVMPYSCCIIYSKLKCFKCINLKTLLSVSQLLQTLMMTILPSTQLQAD